MDILAMIQAIPGIGPYLPYILILFGCCAVLAAQLPPPRQPESLYGMLYRVVNLLGQNYNHAHNATDPGETSGAPPAAIALLLLAPLATLPALGACSSTASNPQDDVVALEAGLTAAESVAIAYIQLPACTGTNGPLCANPTVVAQIKQADSQAYTLVKAAEQAADDPSAVSAAEAAITALTVLLSDLPQQGS